MRRIGVVALVVVGLYAIVEAVLLLGSNAFVLASADFSMPDSLVYIGVVLVAVALLLVMAAVLLFGRDRLSSRLFGEAESGVACDAAGLLRVALIVVGITLVLGSAPRLVSAAGTWIGDSLREQEYETELYLDTRTTWDAGLNAILGLLQLVAGSVLIGQSSPIARRLWSGRAPQVKSSGTLSCANCGEPYDPEDYTDMASARCVHCGAPLGGGSA